MLSLTHAMILAILVTILVGCETSRIASPHHVTGSTVEGSSPNCDDKDLNDKDKDLCKLATKNLTELAWYKTNEWPYNRGRADKEPNTERPLVCVAISGGGIRSAAFGIGVMQGLHNKEVNGSNKKLLKHVDILSGTSGGAYAVSWYYMQRSPTKASSSVDEDKEGTAPSPSDDELFNSTSEGAFQSHLQKHADFLGMPAYLESVFGNVVLLSPFNLILNGIWGSHTNTSLAHYIYRWNIKDTFHGGNSSTLDKLRGKISFNKLPYFIITTTSRIDENNFHTDSLLRNTVFEFTPLRMGNDGYTYLLSDDSQAPIKKIDEIIAISGAAPDSSQIVSGSAQRFLSSGLNADYGFYINNYNDKRHQFRRSLTKWTPFPFYFFTETYNRDLRGSDIYLSDGGHQENLAAYPLIRRQCENLIIVDGEYDPNYEFESYFKLKNNIERELQVTMTLTPTNFCKKIPRDDCRETDIDRIQKELRDNTERPGTRGEAEDRRQGIPYNCCFTGQHPIVSGTIRAFPIFNEQTKLIQWKEITVTYIKMAIDEGRFKEWTTMPGKDRNDVRKEVGADATDYFANTITNTCDVRYFYPCAFPQFSTAYQSFTAKQFKAYVDLGATMITRHLDAKLDQLNILQLIPK